MHYGYFVVAIARFLPYFFSPCGLDHISLNFSDPWPSNRHAKRRLTHGNFLKLYRQVLKMGGQIHFKTDNQPLFEFSVEEIPRFGFTLSEVTRDLHANGPVGVMTDYEAKFYEPVSYQHLTLPTNSERWTWVVVTTHTNTYYQP